MKAQIGDGVVSGNSSCIALMCDEGYLFPTLVCAKQAREHAPPDVDIVIFLDAPGLDEQRRIGLERVSGASIRPVPKSVVTMLEERIPRDFFTTHVNRSALFRLFVAELLDKRYDRILYMDGDIQIRGSLAPLFEIPLPDGHVAAVPDWHALHSLDGMPFVDSTRAYLTGLGLSPQEWGSYFNSGVMMASSETWSSIGSAALEFLIANQSVCLWHDQSALNHVCRGRTTSISVRWNFLRHYMALDAFANINPPLLHFVGKLKPWDGAFAPWGRNEFKPYVEMAQELHDLGVVWKRKSAKNRLLYHVRPYLRTNEYSDADYKERIEGLLLQLDTLPGGVNAAPDSPAPHISGSRSGRRRRAR